MSEHEIEVGEVFRHAENSFAMVVVNSDGDDVSYTGLNTVTARPFYGRASVETFLKFAKSENPRNLERSEAKALFNLAPDVKMLLQGTIVSQRTTIIL